jgi:hypothetical protein
VIWCRRGRNDPAAMADALAVAGISQATTEGEEEPDDSNRKMLVRLWQEKKESNNSHRKGSYRTMQGCLTCIPHHMSIPLLFIWNLVSFTMCCKPCVVNQKLIIVSGVPGVRDILDHWAICWTPIGFLRIGPRSRHIPVHLACLRSNSHFNIIASRLLHSVR